MNRIEDLIVRVQALVADVDKTHRYSMSRIYGLYNEVYGLEEIPQSCASCLIRKVKQLKEWLLAQEKDKPEEEAVKPKRRKMPRPKK
jgi:hypothetical protein